MKKLLSALLVVAALCLAQSAAAIDLADCSVHTSDATSTPTTCWTPQDDATFRTVLTAVCRQSNGTARASFVQTALVSKDSGAVTVAGLSVQTKEANVGATLWALAASISSGQIVMTFTGGIGQTVDCNMYFTGVQVGPF